MQQVSYFSVNSSKFSQSFIEELKHYIEKNVKDVCDIINGNVLHWLKNNEVFIETKTDINFVGIFTSKKEILTYLNLKE